MPTVTLRSGRVQPVWAGHPWIFAQAIDHVDGAPGAGDVVEVQDPRGHHLGRGFWSPKSAIPVRLITREIEESLDEAALIRRVERAAALRRSLGLPSDATTGYRLIHAEGDGLPGLIVDVFAEVAVVQLGTIGMKQREELLFGAISRVSGATTILERPAGQARRNEGFEAEGGTRRGPSPESLAFVERDLRYEIELSLTQKTGFYCDQRDNRALVERFADGRRVLDLYSYVGAFGLAAARGGASEVQCYDSSSVAVTCGAAIARVNGLDERVAFARADIRKLLPKLHRDGERFDMVIADPPKLAPTARHQPKAKRAYRKLNARAMTLLRPGGLLLSCSCSAAMRAPDLLRTLAVAAKDAGRTATLLHLGQAGLDHPTPAAFPEGRYLKAALLSVS